MNWCKLWVIFLLLVLIFLLGCEREAVFPQRLIGVWKTSAPKYADRYMKISQDTLIYGIGNGEEVSHTIDKIDMKQGDDGAVYTFHLRDAEGEKESLTFTFRPDSGGTLQIKNGKEIWKKDKSGGAR